MGLPVDKGHYLQVIDYGFTRGQRTLPAGFQPPEDPERSKQDQCQASNGLYRGQSEAASAQPLHSDRRTAENLVRDEVRSFLNEAAPDIAIDDFLSGDVVTNLLFMEALASVSQEYVFTMI